MTFFIQTSNDHFSGICLYRKLFSYSFEWFATYLTIIHGLLRLFWTILYWIIVYLWCLFMCQSMATIYYSFTYITLDVLCFFKSFLSMYPLEHHSQASILFYPLYVSLSLLYQYTSKNNIHKLPNFSVMQTLFAYH